MNLFKKVLSMGLLSIVFSSANAYTPMYASGTTVVVEFESVVEDIGGLSTQGLFVGAFNGVYDHASGNPPADIVGLSVGSSMAGSFNMEGNYLSSLDTGETFTSLFIGFHDDVSSFSFDIGNIENPWRLEAFSWDSVLLGSTEVAILPSANDSPMFGLSSVGPAISYAILTNTLPNTPERLFMDNVTFTTAVSPVPEPSVVALMLGGLSLVGFMARRRRQQV